MRRARSALTLASLAAVALGCGDTPQAPAARPTAPSLALSGAAAVSCAPATARTIHGEITTLLASKDQTEARTLFREVEAACTASNLVPAEAKAAAYYRFFLVRYFATPSRVRGTQPAAASAVHFGNIASFIGQGTRFVSQHFTTGAIGVCPTLAGSTARCILTTADNEAGISVPSAALGGTARLFSIAPASAVGTACKNENLEPVGPCYQFDATPARPFEADVALSVCVNDGRGSRLRLAHPEPHPASASEIEVTPPVDLGAVFGSEQPACGPPASGSLQPAGPGLLGAWHRLGALAARGWSYLGPRTAYAVHAGVGGGVRELSPFGAVDPLVFAGIFDDPTRFPLGPLTSPVDDERGTWTSSVESPPGSITVAESLGDLGTEAGDRILVLNQGGGACDACSKLNLTGTLRPEPAEGGTTATTGRYRVEWSSVQGKETSKLAPIDLQDGGGRVIARLAYRTVGSANQLVVFGRDATTLLPVEVVLGRWTVNTANTFVLEVDLEAKRFQVVSVAPQLGQPVSLPRTLRYLNELAAGLDRYVITFGGIDAGILGLDDVRIRRLPDR